MMLWMRRNRVKCTTADLFHNADLALDIQKTGLPDESYDLIIANHVLEHVDDFREALKEIHRILRPDGLFICSFPMDPKVEILDEDESIKTDEMRLSRYGQNDHKRLFGLKADHLLADAGFSVTVIKGEDYPNEILPVVGPADYDMNRLFCCRKSGMDRMES
jgi:SAM-dependent methyltransferase